MSTIGDYADGSILLGIAKAMKALDSFEGLPGIDPPAVERIVEKIREFQPMAISLDAASSQIREASTVALGERVCRALHPDSPATDSVFLDDLAVAMIETGKARLANSTEAITALNGHFGHPLVITMVSGKYMEICASHRPDCVFWRAEQHGVRCFERQTRT